MRTIATHIYNIVLSAVMLLALGGCVAELEEAYQKKHEARGGFKDRVFLIRRD